MPLLCYVCHVCYAMLCYAIASQHSPQIRFFFQDVIKKYNHWSINEKIEVQIYYVLFELLFMPLALARVRACWCLTWLAGVSLMLCISCASCSRPRLRLLYTSTLIKCTACRGAVSGYCRRRRRWSYKMCPTYWG